MEILHKLAKDCDVLVENYLPGALKKYNMDYESVAKVNPNIVYASITGYGQTGPYSNRAGYDVMVEAFVLPQPRSVMSVTNAVPVKWASCTSQATVTDRQPRSA